MKSGIELVSIQNAPPLENNRKQYHAPQLEFIQDIRDVTLGISGGITESGTGWAGYKD